MSRRLAEGGLIFCGFFGEEFDGGGEGFLRLVSDPVNGEAASAGGDGGDGAENEVGGGEDGGADQEAGAERKLGKGAVDAAGHGAGDKFVGAHEWSVADKQAANPTGVEDPAEAEVGGEGLPDVEEAVAVAAEAVMHDAIFENGVDGQAEAGEDDGVDLRDVERAQNGIEGEQDEGKGRDEGKPEPGGEVAEEAEALGDGEVARGEEFAPVAAEDLGVAEGPAPALFFEVDEFVGHQAGADDFIDVNGAVAVDVEAEAEVGIFSDDVRAEAAEVVEGVNAD